MQVTPDTVNPFYPFGAGPTDFVEPSLWLSGIVDGTLTGKMPLGLITNATFTTAPSQYNEPLTILGGIVVRNALGLSTTVVLAYTIGSQPTATAELTNVPLSTLDGSTLTYVDTSVVDSVTSVLKINFNSSLLKDFLALDIADGTYYEITQPVTFLQTVVRARPTNPLQLTVVTPSQANLRYKSDPAPARYVMPTTSPVQLIEGYNAVVRLDNAGAVGVGAAAGAGLGVYPICPERYTPNAPAGLTPLNNNINIVGDACHPTYMFTHPDDPATTKRMLVYGNCTACCSCQDYLNVLKAIEKLGISWGTLWDSLGPEKTKYDFVAQAYYAAVRRMGKLSITKSGYSNISVFHPDTYATNKSGVIQLYTSVSLYDPLYVDDIVLGNMEPTLHTRSVKLTNLTIKLEGISPLFINNPNAASVNRVLSITRTSKGLSFPVKTDFIPVFSIGNTDTLTVDNISDLGIIELKPGGNIEIDLTACVGTPQIYSVVVDLTWTVAIAQAPKITNPGYNADIINDDPKSTQIAILAEYVVPGL